MKNSETDDILFHSTIIALKGFTSNLFLKREKLFSIFPYKKFFEKNIKYK